MDKTGKHCKNTAKHAPNMSMRHGHVPISVCTISIKWKIQNQPIPVQWTTSCRCQWNLINENYELHGKDRAKCASVVQTLQSMRQPFPCTMPTCAYRFVRFPCCGKFKPTRTSPVKQHVETTDDSAGETSKTKNKKKGWTTCAPVERTLQSMRQTCARTMATWPYPFVRFPLSEKIKPTRTCPVNHKLPVTNRCCCFGYRPLKAPCSFENWSIDLCSPC